MLTQCSACGAVFRVRAIDLRAAQGLVECGACRARFSALDRLVDEPRPPADVADAGVRAFRPAPAAPAERGPVFRLFDPDRPAAASSGPTASAAAGPGAPGSDCGDTARPAIHEPGSGPGVTPSLTAEAHVLRGVAADPGDTGARTDTPPAVLRDEVPAVIREQVAALGRARAGTSMTWFWAGCALLLGAALTAQGAWWYREALFANLPAARIHAVAVCARLGCDVNPVSEPDAIEIIARDVRDHPQYRDALLVNATLINRAAAPTAFPVIQLSLFDHIGTVLGVRRFEPREYLDRSIDIGAGMPAGRPVFLVLEIASHARAAVSFEFTFL